MNCSPFYIKTVIHGKARSLSTVEGFRKLIRMDSHAPPFFYFAAKVFNALSVPGRGTGQPPGACGSPRNSYAPCLKRARRKVPVSAVSRP